MGFIESASDYMKKWFNKKNEICLSECIDLITETAYKELGLRKVISMLSNSLINTEFKTYEKNVEVKKDMYYAFNVSPNTNSNKYDFCFNIINNLIREEETLIVEINNQFFVAERFQKEEYALKEYEFYDIEIDKYKLKDVLHMKDVAYLRLNDKKIKALINTMNNNYSKISALAENSYVQSKLRKIIVNFDSTFNMKDMDENTLQKTINDIIKPFIEGERNVLTLPKGLSLENIDNKNNNNSTTVEEIKSAGKEIYENTISVFNIPLDLAYVNKAELKEQKNQYMTQAYKPFATMIETELNRKLYGRQNYKKGTYLKLDLNTSEYINALECADGLDKLFRIGFSHNYLRKRLGEIPLEEEWANRGYVTKNYMDIEGGEKIDE